MKGLHYVNLTSMNLTETLTRALDLDERGEIAQAVACLAEIKGEIPDEPAYQKLVGMLYQRLGEDAESLPFLTRAAVLNPEDAEVQLALGFHHVDNAGLEEALVYFQETLRLDPNHQTAQMYLGRVYDFLGDFESAEKALIRAMMLGAEDLEPHIQLGRVFIRAGKLDQAEVKFRQIEDMSPGHVMAEIGAKRVAALKAGGVATAGLKKRDPATVVCVKQGTKYGPDYVNRLAAMVRRNSSHDPDFVCFTEDATGLDGGIRHLPLPDPDYQGWWNKVSLYRGDLDGVGGRMLYFDLDVVLTGSIDPLLTYDSDFAIMDNDYVPGFNTSVFLLKTGSRPEIRDAFNADMAAKYDGDQDWVAIMAPDAELWPAGWCAPFRLRAAQTPPENCKAVVFSGRPNPADYPADWVRELWG